MMAFAYIVLAAFWYLVFTAMVVRWAAAWRRSVGWALLGSLLFTPAGWSVVLTVLGPRDWRELLARL